MGNPEFIIYKTLYIHLHLQEYCNNTHQALKEHACLYETCKHTMGKKAACCHKHFIHQYFCPKNMCSILFL